MSKIYKHHCNLFTHDGLNLGVYKPPTVWAAVNDSFSVASCVKSLNVPRPKEGGEREQEREGGREERVRKREGDKERENL